jgi:hypothetical protein
MRFRRTGTVRFIEDHSALDYLSPEAYEQLFHQRVLTLA